MATYLIIFGAAVSADGTPSGSLQRRVDGAILAGRADAGMRFMPTGGRGATGYVEAEVMRDLLLAAGIAPARIIVEDRARDTLESVQLCNRLLRREGDVEYVEICTSRYHQPRCALLLRLLGWRVKVAHTPSDYGKLPIGKLVQFTLKEFVATPYDAVLLVIGLAVRPFTKG